MNPLVREIRSIIDDAFLKAHGGDQVAHDDSVSQPAVIDANGAVELVKLLEERYPFHVADEELVSGNVESISSLVSFLERKLAAAQGGV